jgi:hypothetical protein
VRPAIFSPPGRITGLGEDVERRVRVAQHRPRVAPSRGRRSPPPAARQLPRAKEPRAPTRSIFEGGGGSAPGGGAPVRQCATVRPTYPERQSREQVGSGGGSGPGHENSAGGPLKRQRARGCLAPRSSPTLLPPCRPHEPVPGDAASGAARVYGISGRSPCRVVPSPEPNGQECSIFLKYIVLIGMDSQAVARGARCGARGAGRETRLYLPQLYLAIDS